MGREGDGRSVDDGAHAKDDEGADASEADAQGGRRAETVDIEPFGVLEDWVMVSTQVDSEYVHA